MNAFEFVSSTGFAVIFVFDSHEEKKLSLSFS